ncbi:hypothetical protein CH373_10420 [Leptospira perolatii]|uniref:Tetratricopeptide repeat protein n=1 Tax=Leptospira perolatii TaxID=2023191 RepID=A0A2M9ZMX9_9LEPT|nr:tetratricopeptide repeat protein [Leptospira perolatii]PJZ68296.1 hypothetical protein CH360_17050 [Leptospira perolatii]PJZ73418.1 hypothetical protein CH373_10420 [Leptospira perolatii]
MKRSSTIPIYIFLASALPFLAVQSEGLDPSLLCKYLDTSGKTRVVPPSFYLSLALENMSRVSMLAGKEAAEENLEAIGNFEKYFLCSEAQGQKVGAVSHWNKAAAHYNVQQWDLALAESDFAEEKDPTFKDTYILKTKILIRLGDLQKATLYLESNLSRFPDDSDMYYLLSSLNLELKNYPKAILYLTSLSDSIQNREGNPKYRTFVYKSLGELYFAQGQNNKALFYISNYMQLSPTDWNTRFLLARILNQLGKFSQSKAELLRILKQKKQNSSVELMLGEMIFIESRSSALAYFESLNRENRLPKDSILYGLYCVLVAKDSEARRVLAPIREKYPRRLSVRLGILELNKKEKNHETREFSKELLEIADIALQAQLWNLSETLVKDAIYISEKIKDETTVLAAEYNFLSTVYENAGSVYRALLAVRKAVELSNNPEEKRKYNLHLSYILRGTPPGEATEAEQITKQILTEDPGNAYAQYLLGVILSQEEKYRESKEAFTAAIEKQPDTAIYYFYRAAAFEKIGMIKEMEDDLRKSIELDPESPVSYNYLGYYFSEAGTKLEEALQLIKKAVELAPDNEAYQDSLGWIYFKLGKPEHALLHLNFAAQILQDKNEKDPTIFEHLGDVHFDRGDHAEAKTYWEKSASLFQKKEDKLRLQEKLGRFKANPVSNHKP